MVGQDFLSEQINAFELFLESEEYNKRTISTYTKYLLKYLNWLDEQNLANHRVTEENIVSYFSSSKLAHNSKPDFKSNRAAIHKYYCYSTGQEYRHKMNKECSNQSVVKELNCYDQYLDEVRGFAEATRISHLSTLERFLVWLFKYQAIEIDLITIPVVQKYLSTEIKHLQPVSKNSFISKLRSFIRYQEFKGIKSNHGLLTIRLSAPVYKLAGVPITFETEDLEQIRATYNLNKPAGVRDLAIFFCFTELGLRASEVANLSLDDFNWHEGTVIIRKTKTHQARIMPLPQRCGEWIYVYLKTARPESLSRIVFLRFAHQRGDAMGRDKRHDPPCLCSRRHQ